MCFVYITFKQVNKCVIYFVSIIRTKEMIFDKEGPLLKLIVCVFMKDQLSLNSVNKLSIMFAFLVNTINLCYTHSYIGKCSQNLILCFGSVIIASHIILGNH